MEQLNHFEAAILAAGVTCVYNADDWDRSTEAQAPAGDAPEAPTQHEVFRSPERAFLL